jgi:hypothetical protein
MQAKLKRRSCTCLSSVRSRWESVRRDRGSYENNEARAGMRHP